MPFGSPFGHPLAGPFVGPRSGSADVYAIAGDSPELVADFPNNFFRKAGSTTTFAGLFAYAGASDKYYRDSAGVVKVKTTGNARQNHYQWSGSAWVDKGLLIESAARTNLLTYSDDLTNAIYTKTNMTTAKTATGADGVANSATKLTASAANGTCISSVTSASAKHVYSALVKRITGTGTVEITVDNGTTWEAITSDINTSRYVQVATLFQTIADPDVGFRIVTSGDEIAVQFSQVEVATATGTLSGGNASSPIPTSGSTQTRAAETLTIAGSDAPANTSAMSFHWKGTWNYADTGVTVNADKTYGQVVPWTWYTNSSNYIRLGLACAGADTGKLLFMNEESANFDDVRTGGTYYSPGPEVAVNIGMRLISTAMNMANEGTLLTEDAGVTAIADLSAQPLRMATTMLGTIDTFRMWGKDIADSGITTAST